MFAEAIMAAVNGRIDGKWNACFTETDSHREDSPDGQVSNTPTELLPAPSRTSLSLDNAYETIDGMTTCLWRVRA